MPRASLFALIVTFAFVNSVRSENWLEFRGPAQGHYAGKLPTEWSSTKNVVWKQAVPGKGWSSPIVLDGRVYLTTALPDNASKDQLLLAICLDAATGKTLWQTEVFRQDEAAPRIHSKNSHASPTPLSDGKRLYVHFGHRGTAGLDLDGKVLWRNTDLGYTPVHGNGGTPIFVDGKLVFACDGSNKQFVAALDPADGKVIWKTDRNAKPTKGFSFGTPLAITVAGKQQIVSPASDAVMAYDPADGGEIWRVRYNGYSVIPQPVFGHGMIYLGSGYDAASVMAIRVDGKGEGDVTKTLVAWTLTKAAPHTPSPLLVGNELYVISDRGIATCVDARTGKPHWQERVGGNFSASPFYSDGKIYFQSEEGVTTVIAAGTAFKRLAENTLNEKSLASYAAADGAIFLRTEKHLYRIQAR